MSLNECRVDSVGQRNLGKILGEIILHFVGTESSWERGGCGRDNGGGSWCSAVVSRCRATGGPLEKKRIIDEVKRLTSQRYRHMVRLGSSLSRQEKLGVGN